MEVKYRLESLNETEFKLNYDFDFSQLSLESVQLQVGHDIKISEESQQVVIKATATLFSGHDCTTLASNTVQLTFGVSPMEGIIDHADSGKITVKSSILMDTFLIATIGTLRGVFLKNLKGTPLERCFIPLIPLDNLRQVKK